MSIRILKPNSGIPPVSPRDDSREPSVDAGTGRPVYKPGACFTALQKAPVDEVSDPAIPQAHGGSPVPFVTAADLLELGAVLVVAVAIFIMMADLYL